MRPRFDLGDGAELRHFEIDDAEELFRLTDENRDRLRKWLPWVDKTKAAKDSRAFIKSTHEQWKRHGSFSGGIWCDGRIAGAVGLFVPDKVNLSTGLGYWIGAEFEGRGLVTRAVRTLTSHVFEDLGLHRLWVHCAVDNRRSRAIPERLGFVQEGVLRQAEQRSGGFIDVAVYGMVATEWA